MDNVLFEENAVTVTRSRLTLPGRVFAIGEIHSARTASTGKHKLMPLAFGVFGLALTVYGAIRVSGAALILGIMFIVVALIAWLTQTMRYRLLLDMPGGEVEALTSMDAAFVARVARALEQARALHAVNPEMSLSEGAPRAAVSGDATAESTGAT